MNEPDAPPQTEPTRPSGSRYVKLAFLTVAVLGFATIYFYLQKTDPLPVGNWIELPDPAEAVKLAAVKGRRRIVILFAGSPRSQECERLVNITLKVNKNNIQAAGVLAVYIKVGRRLNSDMAKRYKLKRLPTTLLLDATGKELNRRQGYIGQGDFEQGFLDLGRIENPEP